MQAQQAQLEKVSDAIRQLNTELEAKVEDRTQILKEALQRLEESQAELSEALDKERQLNEIKSRFVAMASHEFRTPLSAVLSSASLLRPFRFCGAAARACALISVFRSSFWRITCDLGRRGVYVDQR